MLFPRRQFTVDCDFTQPFVDGYYLCRRNKRLYRAHFLLLQQKEAAKPLLALIGTISDRYTGKVRRTERSLVFTLNQGRYAVATATYDLARDELIDVRSYLRRQGLARLLVGFICRHFGPRYITARASTDQPGAPTHVLLLFYASFGYQIIPNSNRLTLMTTRLADIVANETVEQEEDAYERESESAAASELADDETVALRALRASTGRNAAIKLRELYNLLHEPNSATIHALLSAMTQTPASMQTAATIYTQEWFDQQPWADYHKREFATALLNMYEAVLQQTNSTWVAIAGLDD